MLMLHIGKGYGTNRAVFHEAFIRRKVIQIYSHTAR